jgi:hypothetical protein
MHREKEVRYDPDTGEKIVTEFETSSRPLPSGTRVERVIEKPTIIKKRAGIGTWLGGAFAGLVLAAGGYALLAHEQGSYQGAGAVVDQKLAGAEQASQNAAEKAGDAAKDAGQRIENATDTKPDRN